MINLRALHSITPMAGHNSNTGALEVYDIANNALTGAYSMGAVGLNWQVGVIAADPSTASAASEFKSGRPTRASDGWIWRRRGRQLECYPPRCRYVTADVINDTAAHMRAARR
jgi:hypothetical protein